LKVRRARQEATAKPPPPPAVKWALPSAILLDKPNRKEVLMNTIDDRNSMEKRLTAWKAKMKDLILRSVSQEGEPFLRSNQDLNLPITEMSFRIEQRKNVLPTESTPQRKNIDNGLVDIRGKYVLQPKLSWTGLYGKEPWPREKKMWEKV